MKIIRSNLLILFILFTSHFQLSASSAENDMSASSVSLLAGPYVIGVTTNSATVCWNTHEQTTLSWKYRALNSDKWNVNVSGPAIFHTVTVSNLFPWTRYEIQICLRNAVIGETSFTTAPQSRTNFVFYVYGDTRTRVSAHSRVASAISNIVRKTNTTPTFIVHLGDFAEYGSDMEETSAQFFRPAQQFLSMLSLIPVRGNHENGTDLFPKYFPLPQRTGVDRAADDYYQDYGDVRIIVIDVYHERMISPQRLKWLEERLSEASDCWRIVCLHEPVYSSGSHGPFPSAKDVEKILVKGKAHVVFTAHDHHYERTRPVHGVTYFVSGGGGAPLRRVVRPIEQSVKSADVLHFIQVNVADDTLTICVFAEGKDKNFEQIDKVEIPRNCGWE
jgi:predicted phosphodiesterase